MNLDDAIKKRGKTRAQIAAGLNTTYATIYRWATGIHEPGIDEIRKLVEILKCSSDELLGIKPIRDPHNDPAEATVLFTETVNHLLELSKSIDEPEEITEMVADLIDNGEANYDATKRFILLVGEAAAKAIQFLRRLQNTPEADEALETIEREMARAA